MSARRIVSPVYVLDCDHCGKTFHGGPDYTSLTDRSIRRAAELEGWKIRPWIGKGSRTAPDLCPDCKPLAGAR